MVLSPKSGLILLNNILVENEELMDPKIGSCILPRAAREGLEVTMLSHAVV
jgi:hypothetical protein